jgi:DMSO reductase anchor subunit
LASARLYLAPGRPAWNSPFTIAEFLGTTLLLGVCGAAVLTHAATKTVPLVAIALSIVSLVAIGKLCWLMGAKRHELRGAAHLLLTDLGNLCFLRCVLPIAALMLYFSVPTMTTAIATAVLMFAGEFVGRYLFFVSVVPSNMATEYLHAEAA